MKSFSKLLIEARFGKFSIPIAPSHIKEIQDGYDVQDEMISLGEENMLGKQVGWKIGATNEAAQKMLGFGPFYGPIFEKNVFSSSSKISSKELGCIFKAAEVEFAFQMKESLIPRSKHYTNEEVWNAVEYVTPAMELAASRISGQLTPALTIADFALNGGVIFGSTNYETKSIKDSIAGLAQAKISLEINSKEVAATTGSSVLGNPLYALTWLVNELNAKNKFIAKGDFVITGAAIQYRSVVPGDTITARFQPFATSHVKADVITVTLIE